MYKRLGIIIGVVALALIFIFVLMNQDSTQEVTINALDRGSLRVAVHSGVPGMGYHLYMDEDLEGFEIDLSQKLAEIMFGSDKLVDLKDASTKTALYMLNNNTVDCVIATQVDKNDSDYAYSQSYYTDTIRVLYANGSYNSLSSFSENQIIGVINGTAANAMLTDLLDDLDDPAEIKVYESYADAKEALERGQIDAFCGSEVFLTEMKEFSGFDLGASDYVVVVRKGDTKLLERIDEALDQMRQNGQLSELASKWL